MKITIAMLQERSACSEGMAWVRANLPDGAEFQEFIEKLEAAGHEDWARWLLNNLGVQVLAEKWCIDRCMTEVPVSGKTPKVDEDSAQIGSSGDSAQIGSSGDYAQIGSSGDSAQIGSSGDYAKIGSSGYSAKIGSSGYYAKIGSSGDYAQIGSSGDSAKIGSSGRSAKIGSSGKDSIIASAGMATVAKIGANGCFSLPWHDGKRYRIAVGYEGEDNIVADTWYRVDESGKIVAAK